MIFIHEALVVESHPRTREIRDLLRPRSTPTWNRIYFSHEQLAHLHPENIQTKLQIYRPMKTLGCNHIELYYSGIRCTFMQSTRTVWIEQEYLIITESCFRHPLFDLRGTRKVEIRHTNFHFSSKKVTSKSWKVEVFDLTIVKKLSTFRPKKAEVEK